MVVCMLRPSKSLISVRKDFINLDKFGFGSFVQRVIYILSQVNSGLYLHVIKHLCVMFNCVFLFVKILKMYDE